jgi:hypothetical protein
MTITPSRVTRWSCSASSLCLTAAGSEARDVEAQVNGAGHLVDVLPARPLRAHVAEFHLMKGHGVAHGDGRGWVWMRADAGRIVGEPAARINAAVGPAPDRAGM